MAEYEARKKARKSLQQRCQEAELKYVEGLDVCHGKCK
jgi:hypothetical protein